MTREGHTSVSLRDELVDRVYRLLPRIPIAKVEDLRSRGRLAPAIEYLVKEGLKNLESAVVPLDVYGDSPGPERVYSDRIHTHTHTPPIHTRED